MQPLHDLQPSAPAACKVQLLAIKLLFAEADYISLTSRTPDTEHLVECVALLASR